MGIPHCQAKELRATVLAALSRSHLRRPRYRLRVSCLGSVVPRLPPQYARSHAKLRNREQLGNNAVRFGFGAMNINNEDCPGLYPVIRNSLVGFAPIPRKISGSESNRRVPLSQLFFRIDATPCSRAITPLASSLVIRV